MVYYSNESEEDWNVKFTQKLSHPPRWPPYSESSSRKELRRPDNAGEHLKNEGHYFKLVPLGYSTHGKGARWGTSRRVCERTVEVGFESSHQQQFFIDLAHLSRGAIFVPSWRWDNGCPPSESFFSTLVWALFSWGILHQLSALKICFIGKSGVY